MAISPDYPGLSAEVIVDGQPLKEYEDNDTTVEREPHTVVRYVRVNSNARFGVRVTIPTDLKCKHGVWINLKVDGEDIECTVDGAPVTQKLRFCGIDIDEEGTDLDDKMGERLKHVGVITLKLFFIDAITKRIRPYRHEWDRAEKLSALGKVAEKNLKGDARSHQASLEPPKFCGADVISHDDEYTDYHQGKLFANFHLKYRSISALKALQIIPRTPIPPPTQRTRDLRSPPPTQRIRNQVRQEPTEGIKREADVMSAGGEVQFMSSKRLKHLPTHQDEVIVLE